MRALFRRAGAIAIVLLGLTILASSPDVAAKAPPHATTIVQTNVYGTPDAMGATIGVLAADTQVELTGEAAPGFLAIHYGDMVGWVPAPNLTLGIRPGIDTAVAQVDTPLLDAPMREADVLETVPEGETVILTGASVGGYDAASYDGTGGWIDERDVAR